MLCKGVNERLMDRQNNLLGFRPAPGIGELAGSTLEVIMVARRDDDVGMRRESPREVPLLITEDRILEQVVFNDPREGEREGRA